MKNESINIGCNRVLDVHYELYPNRPVVILSNGYGVFNYNEAVCSALVALLDKHQIGHIQYLYPQRDNRNNTLDLFISDGIEAIDRIYQWINNLGYRNIWLFGISYGGNISIETALLKNIDQLILVNPVFDYVDYRSKQLGIDQMKSWKQRSFVEINYFGINIRSGWRFIEEAENQNLFNRAKLLSVKAIAFQAANDSILQGSEISYLSQNLEQFEYYQIPDSDHVFDGADGIAFFISRMEKYLQKNYPQF